MTHVYKAAFKSVHSLH